MNPLDEVYDAERLLKESGPRVPQTLRSMKGHRKAKWQGKPATTRSGFSICSI
jgi:hypothetical protein